MKRQRWILTLRRVSSEDPADEKVLTARYEGTRPENEEQFKADVERLFGDLPSTCVDHLSWEVEDL